VAAGPVRVGLIGCGYWGKNLARNLFQMGSLGWVCDPSAKVLDGVRATYKGVRAARDLDELLKDRSVRAVAIAAPAEQHHALARRCMLQGKDVFVEKPLALRIAEAEDLVALAKAKRRVLMVGHILEYHPAIRKLKEFVDSGELGDILHIYSNRLNLGKVRTEENILWSFAPHDISVILLLTGAMPEWATTSGQHYLQHDVADVTMSWLSFPGKTRAHIFVSWLHPFKEQKLVVVGSRKMAVFDDLEASEKLRVYDKGAHVSTDYDSFAEYVGLRFGDILVPYIKVSEPLRLECLHFLECVKTRRRPVSDGYDGLRVVKVLDAAQRSLKANGEPVAIEPLTKAVAHD
jgi:UDP-2-acetamido-3-amino-2,3-dideoxy-glucuronate N-acetyltransferase